MLMAKGWNKGERILALLLAVTILATCFVFLTTLSLTKSARADELQVISFERPNPVYTAQVDVGTKKQELVLPATLRAIVELDYPLDSFRQTAPAVGADGNYDYYQYGYIAPKNEAELREAGEKVLYSIRYADGSIKYRIHGMLDNGQNGFFACDENGKIKGFVGNVAVSWTGEGYNGKVAGDYTFTASCTLPFGGEAPKAVITVGSTAPLEHDHSSEEQHCSCGTKDGVHAKGCDFYVAPCTCGKAEDGHERGCIYWDPVCTCPKGSKGHTKLSCPLFVPLADCDCGIDASSNPWEHKQSCSLYEPEVCTCPDGKHDSANKDCLQYKPAVKRTLFASPNGGGANDTDMNNYIETNTTMGNSSYNSKYSPNITIPGIWIDYVNTIWMNKGYNQFDWTATAQTQVPSDWAWDGTANTQTTTGTVQTRADARPAAVAGVWDVYSGQQLRYALANMKTAQIINICANINLDGNKQNWKAVNMATKNITIQGNGFTIYNLGSFSTGLGSAAIFPGFIYGQTKMTISELSFRTAKIVANQNSADPCGIGLFAMPVQGGYDNKTAVLDDFHLYDSMVYGGDDVQPLGYLGHGNNGSSYNNVTVEGCYVYGKDHVSGFTRHLNMYATVAAALTNSYSANTLICGTGGHSGAFISCADNMLQVDSCFAANEMYGSVSVSGFCGFFRGAFTNCFSTGKMEGYRQLGGFNITDGTFGRQTMENCYSTVLVGLRQNAKVQGGFFAPVQREAARAPVANSVDIGDCYAAGEVGNYDTDLDGPENVGGFLSNDYSDITSPSVRRIGVVNTSVLHHNYYDKQTTAMREWVTGDLKTLAGVTGTLTTTTGKNGNGLASGTDPADATSGFTGFSDNTDWVFRAQHYPQLSVFTSASAANWKTQERADQVKAWSKASAATVQLNTWDEGYDWDENGVRSVDTISYDRTLASTGVGDHKGEQFTYDTVRDIVTNFRVTNVAANETQWNKLIAGGAKTADSLWFTQNILPSSISGSADYNASTKKQTLFDEDAASYYRSSAKPTVAAPVQIVFQLSSPKAINTYKLQSSTLANTFDPKNWTFQGSNNGTSWTTLDTQTDTVFFERNHSQLYLFENDTEYAYYRLSITANNGAAGVSLAEMEIGMLNLQQGGIEVENGNGVVNRPGIEWFRVYETHEEEVGYRPLRLLCLMNINAGQDKTVQAGEKYNHRSDVELIMLDTVSENLVVGLDDDKIWSTSKQGVYPDSDRFWAAPTDVMNTKVSASEDAWIYTEIWSAAKDSGGNYVMAGGKYVPDKSVLVTGPGTGSNQLVDEKKWNGDVALYPDTVQGRKYIITYYWMLKDGRYRTDYKVVTVHPGSYQLTLDVLNDVDDTPNADAMYVDTKPDSGTDTNYSFGSETADHSASADNTFTSNVTAAWKPKNDNTQITKLQITMTANNEVKDAEGNVLQPAQVMGTKTVTGDITVGTIVEIPVLYYYYDETAGDAREFTNSQEVLISYEVQQDANGGYYLRFNKIKNIPEADDQAPHNIGDDTGIAQTPAVINDMTYNIAVKLWVVTQAESGGLSIQKKLTKPAEVDEEFVFLLEYRGNGEEPGEVESTLYGVIHIEHGQTGAKIAYVDMPPGWYTVTELKNNFRFTLQTDKLPTDNPDAEEINGASVVKILEDGSSLNYVFTNKRDDVPWANGKTNLMNDFGRMEEVFQIDV